MRTNIILSLIVVALLAALAAGYRYTSLRIDALEARLAELDHMVINVTVPMNSLREDISAIYRELDGLQVAVPGPSREGVSAESDSSGWPEPSDWSARERERSYRVEDAPAIRTESGNPYTERQQRRNFRSFAPPVDEDEDG